MKNLFRIFVGFLVCATGMIIGPIARLLPIDINRPWVDGLFMNTTRAFKKYDAARWIRRFKGILKNPNITTQGLNLLKTKKKVIFMGTGVVPARILKRSHDVSTDHAHHRMRIEQIRSGLDVSSDYGDIIVVQTSDGELMVHDGNHRTAAYHEVAPNTLVKILYWSEIWR